MVRPEAGGVGQMPAGKPAPHWGTAVLLRPRAVLVLPEPADLLWDAEPILIDWEYARLGDPADEIAYTFTQNALSAPRSKPSGVATGAVPMTGLGRARLPSGCSTGRP